MDVNADNTNYCGLPSLPLPFLFPTTCNNHKGNIIKLTNKINGNGGLNGKTDFKIYDKNDYKRVIDTVEVKISGRKVAIKMVEKYEVGWGG